MSRTLSRTLAPLATGFVPPVIGAAYMVGMALWAAQGPTVDERTLGAQARQIDAVVHGPFGGEITRMGIAIGAAAVVAGAVLGWTAAGLVFLRDHLGAPRVRAHRSLLHRSALLLGVVAGLHGAIELRAMAVQPQLYAGAWYAVGGWRRTVHVLATDVLGPDAIVTLSVIGACLFIAGPWSRWPAWPERASRASEHVRERLLDWVRNPWRGVRMLAICAAVGSTATLFALAVGHTPSASAGSSRIDTAEGIAPSAGSSRIDTAEGVAPSAGSSRSDHAAGIVPADDPRPNVIVIAADSLRADRLDPRTAPHLWSLADRGTRFGRAYVSLPRTFPSWVTLLTGRHPHHHGIRSMFPRWEERTRDFDALPERLAKAGWATGVVSDYAGDIFSRIDLGFGTVEVPEFDFRQLVRQRALERETPLLPFLESRLGRAAFPVLREMNDAADPDVLAEDAIHAMRRMQGHGPFFLVVFFSTAHFPYAAPSPYYRRFTDPAYRGRFKYFKPVGLGREDPADERDERQVRAVYDGAVSAIDDAAQSILDALEGDGLAKKTIVVVTADHGETLFEHGHGQGHGDHLFGDEGTHVPLVIVDPRRPHPQVDDTIVRDVDLAPTIYALTGVAPPSDLDGRRLDPALGGEKITPALAYAETGLWFTEEIAGLPGDLRLPYPGIAHLTEVDTQHDDEVVLEREMRGLTITAKHRMVRDERYKLVYVPARKGVRWMLFDTRVDPGEEHDVAAAHPDVTARLQGELWSWMRRDPDMIERDGYIVPRDANARALHAADVGVVRLDPPGGP